MSLFTYLPSGDEILVGDQVEIRRWFRRTLKGTVIEVHDPSRPSIPHGENPFAVSIRLESGDVPLFTERSRLIRLIARGGGGARRS